MTAPATRRGASAPRADFDEHSYRTARLLRDAGRSVIGFWTCDPPVDAVMAARHLAAPLHHASGGRVAVVLPPAAEDFDADAEGHRPPLDGVHEVQLSHSPQPMRALEQALAALRQDHAHVLVPSMGIGLEGDQLAAAARMDGLVLLARTGLVDERQLLGLQRQLGARTLGVLMLG